MGNNDEYREHWIVTIIKDVKKKLNMKYINLKYEVNRKTTNKEELEKFCKMFTYYLKKGTLIKIKK